MTKVQQNKLANKLEIIVEMTKNVESRPVFK